VHYVACLYVIHYCRWTDSNKKPSNRRGKMHLIYFVVLMRGCGRKNAKPQNAKTNCISCGERSKKKEGDHAKDGEVS